MKATRSLALVAAVMLIAPVLGQSDGSPPSIAGITFGIYRYIGGPEFATDSYSPPLNQFSLIFDPATEVARERDLLLAVLTIVDPDFEDEAQDPPTPCNDHVWVRQRTGWFPLAGYFSPEPPPFVLDDEIFCCEPEGFCPPAGDVLDLILTIVIPDINGKNQARLRGLTDEFGRPIDWDARVVHAFEIANEQAPEVFFGATVVLMIGENPAVPNPNAQAFADAGPDLVVEAGTSVQLDGSRTFDSFNVGFDPISKNVFEKDTITYSWEWLSGPERVDPIYPNSSKPAIGEVTLNEIGTYVYRLTADDGVNSIPTSDTVRVQVISIAAENRAPIARAVGPSGVTTVGSIITLNGTSSFDPDGDSLTFRWQQTDEIGGPIPTEDIDRFFQPLSGITSPIASWQAVRPGTFYFRLLISDGEFVASTRVSVQVTETQTAGFFAIREASSSTSGPADAGDDVPATPTTNGEQTNNPVTPLGCGTGAALGVGLVSASLMTMRRRTRR